MLQFRSAVLILAILAHSSNDDQNQNMITTKIVITNKKLPLRLKKKQEGCDVVSHERLTEPRVTMD